MFLIMKVVSFYLIPCVKRTLVLHFKIDEIINDRVKVQIKSEKITLLGRKLQNRGDGLVDKGKKIE